MPRQYLSTDPNAGTPVAGSASPRQYLSTDPNAGAPTPPRRPSTLWERIPEAVYGHELNDQEREQWNSGLNIAGMLGGEAGTLPEVASGAKAAVSGGVRGAVATMGKVASKYPSATNAVAYAVPRLLHGDYVGALENALYGAAMGRMGRGAPAAAAKVEAEAAAPAVVAEVGDAAATLRQAQNLAAAGRTDEARALVDAAREAALKRPAVAPVSSSGAVPAGPVIMPRTAPAAAAPAAAAKATQAELDDFARSISAPRPTPAVRAAESRGRAVAAAHNDLMAMAKAAAKANPKIGAKIWFEVDAAGKPIRVLENGDKAGGVLRSGGHTTFVKNLWGSAEQMFRE